MRGREGGRKGMISSSNWGADSDKQERKGKEEGGKESSDDCIAVIKAERSEGKRKRMDGCGLSA